MWTEYEDDQITDFVFESNYSTREMANILGKDEVDIKRRIRELGLSWVRRGKGHISRGQAALTSIMQELLPGEKIQTEYGLGERLRLDVYCESYKLGAEYHGRQHFQYVPHFHRDIEGFRASQERDERKIELCKELGIALVIFRYCDTLTKEVVFERMMDALRSTPIVEEEKESRYKGNPYYESMKQRNREYRKAQYQRMKKAKRGRG